MRMRARDLLRTLPIAAAVLSAVSGGSAAAQTVGNAPYGHVGLDPPVYNPGFPTTEPTPGYRAGTLACRMDLAMDDVVGGTRSVACHFNPAVPGAPVDVTLTVGKSGPTPPGVGVMVWTVLMGTGADERWLGGNYVSDIYNRMVGGTDKMVRLVPMNLPGVRRPNMAPYVREMRIGS